jgi:catechol 2,3-dioxygenase-like lactoylglutathione lyase family enzyme
VTGDGARLTHIGVCVRDLDRSVIFYRDGLGFDEVGRFEAKETATARLLDIPGIERLDLIYLQRDGFRIELLGYGAHQVAGDGRPRPMDQLGLTHLSFSVNDPQAFAARIEAHGGRLLAERSVVFSGGNQGLMAVDPDGNLIELVERSTPRRA